MNLPLRTLGQTDIKISPLILGTWQAGKRWWVGIEDEESIQALRTGFAEGMTTVDTAEVYGDGHSERIVRAALGAVRDQAIYATKVFSNHLRYEQVIQACERSLENLGTDYLDLYQIHWPAGSFNSELVPIEETMAALNTLKQQGKIRAIGVSNFSLEQLQEASRYGRIDSIQPPYSLFWRRVEEELMPYCLREQISILAYSPLAQGLLTGRFAPGHQFEPGDNRADNRLFQGENFERAHRALAQLRPLADQYQTSLGNLALAWLISQPNTSAIVGVRHPHQALENAQAARLTLSAADLACIDTIGHTVTDHLDPQYAGMWNWA